MNLSFRRVMLKAAVVTTALGVFATIATPTEAALNMSDQAITDKLDEELLHDPGVVSAKIDTNTSDGVVTLTGNVNNLLAKDRATRVAETIKGVRAVINRIEVRASAARTDAEIRQDVETALVRDPATELFEINTQVDDGEVTLSGTVDSYQERELTKTVVKGVRGVAAIVDQLEVEYKMDRPDDEIQQDIEGALRWNTRVDNHLINVSVSDGKATLSGTVGSAAEKRLAETDARVAGVTSVDVSDLAVKGWARDEKLRGDKYVVKSEDELREAVEAALFYDPRLKSFDVDVDVSGSTVTLRGDVDNLQAKRAAEQDARNTVGVSYVDNRLKIRLDLWPDDSDIAEDVREALVRDPYLERFEITVSVVDGNTHLYGSVDSSFEKNRADDVASRVTGVLNVENHLSVADKTAYLYDPYVDDAYINDDDIMDYRPRTLLQTDSEIKASVESELQWSPFVDFDDVNVSVDDGVVTLTGTVDTWGEHQSATENAYDGGATRVNNQLRVKYE